MRMSLPRGFSPLMVLWRGRWGLWHLEVLGTPPNELRNGPGSSGDLLGAASDAFPGGPNVSRLQLHVPLRNGIASLLRVTGEEGMSAAARGRGGGGEQVPEVSRQQHTVITME